MFLVFIDDSENKTSLFCYLGSRQTEAEVSVVLNQVGSVKAGFCPVWPRCQHCQAAQAWMRTKRRRRRQESLRLGGAEVGAGEGWVWSQLLWHWKYSPHQREGVSVETWTQKQDLQGGLRLIMLANTSIFV